MVTIFSCKLQIPCYHGPDFVVNEYQTRSSNNSFAKVDFAMIHETINSPFPPPLLSQLLQVHCMQNNLGMIRAQVSSDGAWRVKVMRKWTRTLDNAKIVRFIISMIRFPRNFPRIVDKKIATKVENLLRTCLIEKIAFENKNICAEYYICVIINLLLHLSIMYFHLDILNLYFNIYSS